MKTMRMRKRSSRRMEKAHHWTPLLVLDKTKRRIVYKQKSADDPISKTAGGGKSGISTETLRMSKLRTNTMPR
jgi:hypothetical protein